MAAVNSKISQADYNTIRNKLINILGSGSGTSGWGQQDRIKSSAVAEGNTVTINEWANLRYDIINSYNHIYGTTPTTYQVAEGNTIRYNASTAPVSAHESIVDTIIANKFSVALGQYATDSGTPVTYSTTWRSSVSCTITVTFPSSNAARYFFNSGGQVNVTSSFTPSPTIVPARAQNTAWQSLLSSSGTQSFGGNNPGTGTSPLNGQNWYRLSNSYQQYYSSASSSPYGSNNYKLFARCNVTDNSTGTASSAEFLVQFTDGYTDPGPPAPGDAVDGTLSVTASTRYSTGVMLPAGLGNFEGYKPTFAVGIISGS